MQIEFGSVLVCSVKGSLHVHTQVNKAINTGPHTYRFIQYWHSKEVPILMNVPTFWIITQEVFIVRH